MPADPRDKQMLRMWSIGANTFPFSSLRLQSFTISDSFVGIELVGRFDICSMIKIWFTMETISIHRHIYIDELFIRIEMLRLNFCIPMGWLCVCWKHADLFYQTVNEIMWCIESAFVQSKLSFIHNVVFLD